MKKCTQRQSEKMKRNTALNRLKDQILIKISFKEKQPETKWKKKRNVARGKRNMKKKHKNTKWNMK